jgi:hypothetical protein
MRPSNLTKASTVTHSMCGPGTRWCAPADAMFDFPGMHVTEVQVDDQQRSAPPSPGPGWARRALLQGLLLTVNHGLPFSAHVRNGLTGASRFSSSNLAMRVQLLLLVSTAHCRLGT